MDDAIKDAAEFGMFCDKSDVRKCHLHFIHKNVLQMSNVDPSVEDDDDQAHDSIMNRDESINLRSYENVSTSEDSKYIQICEKDGIKKN